MLGLPIYVRPKIQKSPSSRLPKFVAESHSHRCSPIHPAPSENEFMEAHPTGAAIPPPIAAPQPPPSTTTPPPPIAPPEEPTAAAVAVAVTTVRSPHPTRFTFLVVAALMSASWFIEPFSSAAAELCMPWPAVVVTLVCFAALFCASVLLFGSFFMPRPPPGAAAVMAAQWKGVRAVVAVFAAVVIGVTTCLIATGGSAYGYGGMQYAPAHF